MDTICLLRYSGSWRVELSSAYKLMRKVMRQVVTTKDLREMCQNGVTLEDLRRLHGSDTTFADLEALPSLLIDNLGLLPCSEPAIQDVSEYQDASQDTMEYEVTTSKNLSEENISVSYDISKEEIENIQDDNIKHMTSTNQAEKHASTLSLHFSMEQPPAAKEIEEAVPLHYDPQMHIVSCYSLLALYLLSQSSSELDMLMSLEILSRLI